MQLPATINDLSSICTPFKASKAPSFFFPLTEQLHVRMLQDDAKLTSASLKAPCFNALGTHPKLCRSRASGSMAPARLRRCRCLPAKPLQACTTLSQSAIQALPQCSLAQQVSVVTHNTPKPSLLVVLGEEQRVTLASIMSTVQFAGHTALRYACGKHHSH